MKKCFKIFILTLTLLFLINAPVFAAEPSSGTVSSKAELDKRYKEIQSTMLKFYKKEITKDVAEKELKKMKAYLIKDENQVGILSNPDSAISLTTPSVIWDSLTGHWFASAYFSWNSNAQWQADFPLPWPAQPGIGVDIGGNDGMGLYFSRGINRYNSTFQTWNSGGFNQVYTYPSSSSAYGVAYSKQDYGYKLSDGSFGYSWDSGYIDVYFEPQFPGQSYSAWAEMAHTWKTSTMSITGISSNGISWQFSDNNYAWEIVSNPATNFTPN